MNAWKLLLPVLLVVFAIAMVPQDPQAGDADVAVNASISELQYVTLQGTMASVPARNVVEIRLLDDARDHLRLELQYDNGDYSLIEAQTFHVLRGGPGAREVRLVRGKQARMRFPRLL